MIEIAPMGQLAPITFETVSDAICPPDRMLRKTFTFPHYAATLRLTVPTVVEDKIMRNFIVHGYSLYDTYRLGMGIDNVPDAALRPCVRNVLAYRYWDPEDGQWKSAPGKFTCDSYWRCFQEYTNAFVKHPATDILDRRMELSPGIFTPSPREEKCIRETFTTQTQNLLAAYQACGCPEIYPTWPGAEAFISNAIKFNPLVNLYPVIKDHYMTSTVGTTHPPGTAVPVCPGITPLPVSPGLEDPDKAALIKEGEELLQRDKLVKLLAIGGGVALVLMLMKK